MYIPGHLSSDLILKTPLFALHKIFSQSRHTKQSFCLVPSIFNQPLLMFMPQQKSLIDHLLSIGHVYIIEWHSANKADVEINDYGTAVHQSLDVIQNIEQHPAVVIAHSFGCILASISVSLDATLSDHLIFLAPPWDFTKYRNILRLLRYTGIYYVLKRFNYIHTRWLPITLYLLNPMWVLHDIKRYKNSENKKHFWAFKKWQFSGLKISYKTTQQLLDQFIKQGKWPHKWFVHGELLQLNQYGGQVSVIAGKKDKIIPSDSTDGIRNCFKNCELYQMDTGHVGCITGNKVKSTFLIIKQILKI